MKNLKSICLLLTLLLAAGSLRSQLSFSLAPSLCAGATVTLSANTGTLSALSYSWAALPSGPVFSSPNASSTAVSFPGAGTFTIGLGVITSSGYAYATNTVQVNAVPIVSIVPSSPSVCAGFNATLTAFGANSYTWTSPAFTAPVNQQSVVEGPGSYTATGANGTCAGSSSLIIGLSPNLQIAVTASSATTCIAGNFPKFSKVVHLAASGAGTYTWLPSVIPAQSWSVDVRPAASTCYTVIGSTAICSGTSIVCVTVVPQFSIAVTPSAPVICSGETVSLATNTIGASAAAPFTYSWTEAANTPSPSLSNYFTASVNAFPQNSTTYTTEVRDVDNCVSLPVFVPITVQACTGLDKLSKNETLFRVYPNPVSDQLFIRTEHPGLTNIEIIDAIGNCVLKENGGPDVTSQNLVLTGLPSGIYLLKLTTDKQVSVLKLVKR